MTARIATVTCLFALVNLPAHCADPTDTWIELRQDTGVARRGCAVRFAPEAGRFFLWGFADADPEFLQENPAIMLAEYDMVAFDMEQKRWQNHLPKAFEAEWSKKLPPTFVPRCYHGLTSGSERSEFRPPDGYPAEVARPDPNIVFDQVAWHPKSKSLVYFTGGLTVAYHVIDRCWTNLAPAHSPPPVLGGSLAYNPAHDEMVLFGGGNIAECRADGRIVGYTGTWVYSFADKDWRRLEGEQPPPRMCSRIVTDAKNQVLVVFGGDGQSHYLGDTWLFDMKERRWRQSKAPGGPPPRAGHFTVYDPDSSLTLIGGGYNRKDLTDMWAFDAAKDVWQQVSGQTPVGAYITADFDPKSRLLLLVRNTRAPNHNRSCDIHYAVRTTFAYRIDKGFTFLQDRPQKHDDMPKRPAGQTGVKQAADSERRKAQADRLAQIPVNQWVALANPGRAAPSRTWGSATFDSDRGRILNWGGGHCGYDGSDVDAYDVAEHTWIGSAEAPEHPHRLYARGVRLVGVTFGGNPWTEHGRRVYAYDPISRKMICVRPILLTTGYVPDALKDYPGEPRPQIDAKVKPPTSYSKFVTWSFDPDTGRWDIVAPAPLGLDTLVTTPHGVMGVPVDWRSRLNDAGHLLEWKANAPEVDNPVYLFDAKAKVWKRLGDKQPSPQNLYELTALTFDTKRDALILHGGGTRRDELWTFDLKTKRWTNQKPKVTAPQDSAPPVCQREAVFLPEQDLFVTYGRAPGKNEPALWVYSPKENVWQRIVIDAPKGVAANIVAGQNRAVVYDAARDLILLVVGPSNDAPALTYALRYRHDKTKAWDQ